MTEAINPYLTPNHGAAAPVSRRTRWRRFSTLLATACVGTLVGSYISAELLHLHFPEEARTADLVLKNTIAAFLSSPLSMSFGVFPSVGFYGTHGFLVIPGILLAIVGSLAYLLRGLNWWLAIAFVGFALWSHNNFLGYNALMSV